MLELKILFLVVIDTIPLDLIVNAAPAIAAPIDPYPLCDNDQNGTEDFDLTSKNTEIEMVFLILPLLITTQN